jgi:hypothetical protein
MAWLCAMLATTLALAAPSVDELDRGKTAFGRAEYARAIGILRPLLYPELRLDSEAEIVQAHRMLGVAHLFENQPDEARREFRKLLEIRPDYRFDPLMDPPRVVEFFNGVLKEEESEITALEARRKQRDVDLAARRQREADERCAAQKLPYARSSFGINFLPFGAGQFQNGQRRKGWLFLGVEAALGAVSVGALATNFALFGVSPRRRCLDPPTSDISTQPRACANIDHSEEALSRNLLRVQVASGALFFVAAAWGIVDAIRNFRPMIPVDVEPPGESGGASSSGSARRGADGHAVRDQVFRPVFRASGLGLEWTY